MFIQLHSPIQFLSIDSLSLQMEITSTQLLHKKEIWQYSKEDMYQKE